MTCLSHYKYCTSTIQLLQSAEQRANAAFLTSSARITLEAQAFLALPKTKGKQGRLKERFGPRPHYPCVLCLPHRPSTPARVHNLSLAIRRRDTSRRPINLPAYLIRCRTYLRFVPRVCRAECTRARHSQDSFCFGFPSSPVSGRNFSAPFLPLARPARSCLDASPRRYSTGGFAVHSQRSVE